MARRQCHDLAFRSRSENHRRGEAQAQGPNAAVKVETAPPRRRASLPSSLPARGPRRFLGAVATGPTISTGILPFSPRSGPNARTLPICGTRPSLRGSSPPQCPLPSRRRHEPSPSHGSLPVRALARACAGRTASAAVARGGSHPHRARNDAMRAAAGKPREGGESPASNGLEPKALRQIGAPSPDLPQFAPPAPW
jgi:hypothetical protein